MMSRMHIWSLDLYPSTTSEKLPEKGTGGQHSTYYQEENAAVYDMKINSAAKINKPPPAKCLL